MRCNVMWCNAVIVKTWFSVVVFKQTSGKVFVEA